MRAGWIVIALLLTGCPGERSPFCARWFQLDEAGRDDEIRERVEGWRERIPVRGPAYTGFMSCVAGYVVDRRAAVDSSCRSLGDLEAGVTIGRLVAAGADACAALPRIPGP